MTWPTAMLAAICVLVAPPPRQQAPAPTRVVRFTPATTFSGPVKSGVCRPSLVVDRSDASRCAVGDTTYDPCFTTDHAGRARCGIDPREPASGVVVESPAGASPSGATHVAGLRAWFFELEDGTTCQPMIFGGGREVDRMTELYTCRFALPGEADGVLGELDSSGPVWTIQQVSLNKKMDPPIIKSLVVAAVRTVWQ
ncbi:MAG TPA: hypothetical protein VLT86_13335 [Vicinamibacterales bacterium]|nr:hypothetical protein [Vicinamibacterales bacterium]